MTAQESDNQRLDPAYGWERATPEPFWIRSWRALFRWRPACYECRITFKTREEHDEHYIRIHDPTTEELLAAIKDALLSGEPFEWVGTNRYVKIGDVTPATAPSAAPKCPHGCKGRLRWVEDQWICRVCGDEWAPDLFEDATT